MVLRNEPIALYISYTVSSPKKNTKHTSHNFCHRASDKSKSTMIPSIARDECVSERMLDVEDVLRDALDHDAASSSGSSLSMVVSDDLVSLEDDNEMTSMWYHEPPTMQAIDLGNSWADSHISGRECTDDQFVKQNPSASNLCTRTVSPVPSVAPSELMEKLAQCMERTALSRNLVESFCQVSFKKCSKAPKHPSITKARSVLHKHIMEKRKGMKTASTPEKKRTLCRNHGAVSEIQQKNLPEQKDSDFRLSGLKMSEEKLKRLDAKLKLLNSEKYRSSGPAAETGPSTISSFFRRHKSSASIESARSA